MEKEFLAMIVLLNKNKLKEAISLTFFHTTPTDIEEGPTHAGTT